MSIASSEISVRNINVAVIGAESAGKKTLARSFLKGYLDVGEDEKESEDLLNPENGIFEVDLDYNNFRYHLNISVFKFKEAKGDFLANYDGVVYMFACNDPDSFIALREYFVRQIASMQELKPRIVVGSKLDMVSDNDLRSSYRSRTTDIYHKNGALNLKEARRWTNRSMFCEYAEINCESSENVDEVFCLLIDIIEKAKLTKKPNPVKRCGKFIWESVMQLLDFLTFCQI